MSTRAATVLGGAFVLAFVLLMLFLPFKARTAELERIRWKPEYAQADPRMQQWFKEQKVPGSTGSCCSAADGEFVEEEIRYDDKGVGHYWTRFSKTNGEWIKVPDEAVIQKPNFHGQPVVWWYYNSGEDELPIEPVQVRCYSPGVKA